MPRRRRNLLTDEMADAACRNDAKAIRRLLNAGQDVNAANESGETAFSYACAHNALAAARLLHAAGADINTIDTGGGSPLDWAVCWASPTFRKWLIKVGGKRNDNSYPEQPWSRRKKG